MAIVYQHTRNDTGEVFYIGIGKDIKRAYWTYRRNRHWTNIYNKYGITVTITHSDIVWEEACVIERYLISFYGRRNTGSGPLVNLTDGGDGVIGRLVSDSARKRIGKKSKENWEDDEYRKKMIAAIKIAANNPITKAKTTKTLNEQRETEFYKIKKQEGIDKKWADLDFKNERIRKIKEQWTQPDFIEANKKRSADFLAKPGTMEFLSNNGKKVWEIPGFRQMQKEKCSKQWESKDFREKVVQGRKKAWLNPEYKAKMIAIVTKKMKENHPRAIKVLDKETGIVYKSKSACIKGTRVWQVKLDFMILNNDRFFVQ